jgi:hypothetical protein
MGCCVLNKGEMHFAASRPNHEEVFQRTKKKAAFLFRAEEYCYSREEAGPGAGFFTRNKRTSAATFNAALKRNAALYRPVIV